MKYIKLFDNYSEESLNELKELIKVELENDFTVESVDFSSLLSGVYTVKLKIDVTWDKDSEPVFDDFRVRVMTLIQDRLKHLGRKCDFRVSLPERSEWYKNWVFSYKQYDSSLETSFYLIKKQTSL